MKTRTRRDYDCYGYEYQEPCIDSVCFDKDVQIDTFLHYSDPDARKERTVFGAAKKGLFYNYSDRLYGQQWDDAWEKAKKKAKLKTARIFELALKYFHDSDDLDLQHIILGCNMSNGYSYLIFGYTYTSKSGQ